MVRRPRQGLRVLQGCLHEGHPRRHEDRCGPDLHRQGRNFAAVAGSGPTTAASHRCAAAIGWNLWPARQPRTGRRARSRYPSRHLASELLRPEGLGEEPGTAGWRTGVSPGPGGGPIRRSRTRPSLKRSGPASCRSVACSTTSTRSPRRSRRPAWFASTTTSTRRRDRFPFQRPMAMCAPQFAGCASFARPASNTFNWANRSAYAQSVYPLGSAK